MSRKLVKEMKDRPHKIRMILIPSAWETSGSFRATIGQKGLDMKLAMDSVRESFKNVKYPDAPHVVEFSFLKKEFQYRLIGPHSTFMIRNYIDKEVTEISEEKLIEIYESAKDH
jgi:hypothetical protein